MPSQSCNWAKILIGGVSHKSKQKGTKKEHFWPINIVSRIQWTIYGNIHLSLFGSFLQKTGIAKTLISMNLLTKSRKPNWGHATNKIWLWIRGLSTGWFQNYFLDLETSFTWDFAYFFGSKILSKVWIYRFVHTIPCTRSNVDPRTVNKLVAKLFPGPGDLFHLDKAILSRHCWLSEKQVTSIKILESDL